MHQFKELKVWNNTRLLVKEIYLYTENFPKEEVFGLTNQIRRSAISISSNIAEGCGRESSIEFARFLDLANGSAFELESQLILANDLSFLSDSDFIELNSKVTEIQKMLHGLLNTIRKN
ncbi:MAG: four helix bundle protein [Melioribacteraceae bacterium]|nr:four helix bundle protein [Melioribacteraceae bacterium]